MTTIHFQDVIPEPLSTTLSTATSTSNERESEIWDCHLSLERGKKYQVYAPSGKGKSTFMHIVYGLRFDFSGKVELEQQDTKQITRSAWAEIRQKKMSIVFQDLRLFLELTAWENLLVKAALYNTNTSEELKRMAECLGIQSILDRKAAFLSYGERQRVAIIRALIQPFDFLLLDEPFSHLDEGNIRKACQLIEEKCEANEAGMIMTSLGYPYYIEFDQRLLL